VLKIEYNNRIESRPLLTSLSIAALMLLFFNLFATPILYSGDDTFLMYMLAGGYGERPSNLLHYNYGWHFALGGITSFLFKNISGVNWYSVILLLYHLMGCTAILYTLLKRLKPAIAILLFSILFLFVETRLLHHFNFTGAAIVAAVGGMCLLIDSLSRYKQISSKFIVPIFLLLVAGMMRMHIVWLIACVFAPIVFTVLSRKAFFTAYALVLLVGAVLFGLNTIHENYYKKNISGWEQKEKWRQAYFYMSNRQLVGTESKIFDDTVTSQLFSAGFLFDTSRFSADKLSSISKAATRNRSFFNKEDRAGLYWFFMELRIYILLFGLFIAALLLQRNFTAVKKWLLSLLAWIVVQTILFVFLKSTTAIHLGVLMVLWLAVAFSLQKEDALFPTNKKLSLVFSMLLLFFFTWIGIRIGKQELANRQHYSTFICAATELRKNPNKLFIATDDNFPASSFYIWDVPSSYTLSNFIYKDRMITNTYLHTLNRFGISDFDKAIRGDKRIYFVGAELKVLEQVYSPAKLSEPLPGFKCTQVRQLQWPQ
jgi:hypothetical protein